MRMCQKRKTMCLCRYKRRQWSRPSRFWAHCQLEKRADELRDILLPWRAGASVRGRQRVHCRKVAAQFGIPQPGNTKDVRPRILHDIAEAFKARVSALRLWCPGTGKRRPQAVEVLYIEQDGSSADSE